MWVTCPARVSRRRQLGTMVWLGSCWQTIPGPSAISSCFLSTKALTEVDCTYLFLFYKADMKDRAVYVCFLLWLGFAIGTLRKTPSKNQSVGVLLMLDPSGLECWDQLATLTSLIVMTFRHDVAWAQLLHSSVHNSQTLPFLNSADFWNTVRLKARWNAEFSLPESDDTSTIVTPSTSALTLKTWPYPMCNPVGNGKASRLQPIRERD